MPLWSVGIIFLLIAPLKSETEDATVQVSLSDEKKPYGAHADCHCSVNIDSSFGLSRCSEIMKEQNVSSAWIPVRKQKLPGWTWVNGIQSVNNIIAPTKVSSGEVECGFLQTLNRRGQIVAKCCFEKHSYLCQGKGTSMKGKWFSLKGHDQIFSINDNPSASWYEARTLCEKNNQTLAILSGNSKYDEALIEKFSILNEEKQKNVWIGVRKWDYFTDSCTQSRLVAEYFWHDGLDCLYTSDLCVRVTVHAGGLRWMPAPCCSSHNHLCIKNVTHIGDASMVTSLSSQSNIWKMKYSTMDYDDISFTQRDRPVIKILFYAAIAFVVVVLLATSFLFLLCYMQGRRARTRNKDECNLLGGPEAENMNKIDEAGES